MISREQIEQIGEWLSQNPLDSEVSQQLRQRFTDIHFTYCMDDDVIGPAPVYSHPAFNLYLVDSSSHCLGITRDMESATGLVVAEIDDE